LWSGYPAFNTVISEAILGLILLVSLAQGFTALNTLTNRKRKHRRRSGSPVEENEINDEIGREEPGFS
jgi:hypothetical protein